MKQQGQTLLQKAQATKVKTRGKVPTSEEVDLFVAYLKGDVNQAQVASALGGTPAAAPGNAFLALRRAYSHGMLDIGAIPNHARPDRDGAL